MVIIQVVHLRISNLMIIENLDIQNIESNIFQLLKIRLAQGGL